MTTFVVAALGSAAAVAAALIALAVRRVPPGHVGVVSRAGRVVRLRSSGVLVLTPGRDRVVLVPLGPQCVDPLRVTASTRDGVEVQLALSVLWRVVDPAAAVHSGPHGAGTRAEEVVERALHHIVARVDLLELLRERDALLARMPGTGRSLLGAVGIEVLDVGVLDVEVRVGPELIRLLA